MTNRMLQFSPIAQRVLKNSEQEARDFQQDAIYPHHLFLALLKESEGVANRALRSYQLNYERVRPLVNLIVSGSYRGAYSPMPELSPQVKHALERAVDAAQGMEHKYIGSEHLLLGLLDGLDDVMTETLSRLKVTPDLLRDRTNEILKAYSEAPTPTIQVTVPEIDAPPDVPPAALPAALDANTATPPTARLTLRDTETGQVMIEVALPGDALEDDLRYLLTLLKTGDAGAVSWSSGNMTVDITVDS